MGVYEVRVIGTDHTITVRSISAAHAAKRITTKRNLQTLLRCVDASATGGVYEVWTGYKYFATVSVFKVK